MVRTPTPNYLRQASQNLGKYLRLSAFQQKRLVLIELSQRPRPHRCSLLRVFCPAVRHTSQPACRHPRHPPPKSQCWLLIILHDSGLDKSAPLMLQGCRVAGVPLHDSSLQGAMHHSLWHQGSGRPHHPETPSTAIHPSARRTHAPVTTRQATTTSTILRSLRT